MDDCQPGRQPVPTSPGSSPRWFFALWPDPGVRDRLASLMPLIVPSDARATHPDDLHLTLAFLGPLDPQRLRCVERAATHLCAGRAFTLRIDQLGHFRHARVLWCGSGVCEPALTTLVEGLWARLLPCGVAADPRPFQPHVTLARRALKPSDAQWEPVDWSVREFVLAAGVGGPPPRYRIRRRWPLTSVPAAS